MCEMWRKFEKFFLYEHDEMQGTAFLGVFATVATAEAARLAMRQRGAPVPSR